MDREKAMHGLECCCTHIVGMSCGNCPYEIEQREDEGISDCTSELAYDALALLKEQETVIRCKDCKHGEKTENAYRKEETYCNRIKTSGYHADNWFCADGERKDS